MTKSHVFILSFLTLAAMKAGAQTDRDTFRQAMDACFTETGVTRTEGVRPSDEDRAKIDACLSAKGITRPENNNSDREAIHTAMQACATENNIAQPSPGNPPSDEDRQKMESCMTSKGLSMPQRHDGGGRGFGGGRRSSKVSAQ